MFRGQVHETLDFYLSWISTKLRNVFIIDTNSWVELNEVALGGQLGLPRFASIVQRGSKPLPGTQDVRIYT